MAIHLARRSYSGLCVRRDSPLLAVVVDQTAQRTAADPDDEGDQGMAGNEVGQVNIIRRRVPSVGEIGPDAGHRDRVGNFMSESIAQPVQQGARDEEFPGEIIESRSKRQDQVAPPQEGERGPEAPRPAPTSKRDDDSQGQDRYAQTPSRARPEEGGPDQRDTTDRDAGDQNHDR